MELKVDIAAPIVPRYNLMVLGQSIKGLGFFSKSVFDHLTSDVYDAIL